MELKFYYYHNFYKLKNNKQLTILPKFKTLQQKTDYTCGPCCAQMVLSYYNNNNFTEEQIANIMGTNSETGTYLKNMVKFFKENGYNVESSIEAKKDNFGKIFSSFNEFKIFLLQHLKNKNIVILENVDYGGHYKVLIGYHESKNRYEQDMLIFADPSDFSDGKQDGYNYFPAERFFSMWFDDNCLEEENRVQPYLVIKKRD